MIGGKLRHHLTLIERADGTNENTGQQIENWQEVKKVRAKLTNLSGREAEQAQAIVPSATTKVVTRVDPSLELNEDHRFIYRENSYEINWINDVEERGRTWELLCTKADRVKLTNNVKASGGLAVGGEVNEQKTSSEESNGGLIVGRCSPRFFDDFNTLGSTDTYGDIPSGWSGYTVNGTSLDIGTRTLSNGILNYRVKTTNLSVYFGIIKSIWLIGGDHVARIRFRINEITGTPSFAIYDGSWAFHAIDSYELNQWHEVDIATTAATTGGCIMTIYATPNDIADVDFDYLYAFNDPCDLAEVEVT